MNETAAAGHGAPAIPPSPPMPTARGPLALADWRRRVSELYAEVRRRYASSPADAHALWVAERERLLVAHPESPLPPGRGPDDGPIGSPPHARYDDAWALAAELDRDVPHERFEVPTSTGAVMVFERIGVARLALGALDVLWLDAYSGGLFVAFRDRSNGHATYGGGRYLLDSAKGADLGLDASGRLVLDLNFAYHPSCAHDPHWACPLPLPDSWIDADVRAGELLGRAS